MCAQARSRRPPARAAAQLPAGPDQLSHMRRHIQTFKLNLTYTLVEATPRASVLLVAYLAT